MTAADEAYLVGISNKGIYKRACKDLESEAVTATEIENGAAVTIGGETCRIIVPLHESQCSCPSRSICRHIIGAILWLQRQSAAPTDFPKPEGLDANLAEELRRVKAVTLKRAMGKQLPELLQMVQESRITWTEGSTLSANLPDGTAVRLLYPLDGAVCTCHSKTLCAHKAAVILAWQYAKGLVDLAEWVEPTTSTTPWTESEQAQIRKTAQSAEQTLCELLRWGLVRMPDTLSAQLEVAAVACHTVKLADGERLLRDIGIRLQQYREHRALFQPDLCLERMIRCAAYLHEMQQDGDLSDRMGTFRQQYSPYDEKLELLPIGIRQVSGAYAGTVYYFCNWDEQAEFPFFTVSDLRPTFYEQAAKRQADILPWNLMQPLSRFLRNRIRLEHAKHANGKLSASKDTIATIGEPANLDAPAIHKRIVHDFRQLAMVLSNAGAEEVERLCLVHPTACLESGYDRYTQRFRMLLADAYDNHIAVEVADTSEQKELLQTLEHIGEQMMTEAAKSYVLLATAYFAEGKVCLYPIDCYDFLTVQPPDMPYALPEAYAEDDGRYAQPILELCRQIEDAFCCLLQAGVQSGYDSKRGQQLEAFAERMGLHGLAERLHRWNHAVNSTRHSMQDKTQSVLTAMWETMQYVQICKHKMEVRSALRAMKGEP